MKNFTIKDLVLNGLVGAIYVALIFIFAELSFNDIQFRIAEVLLIFLFFNKKLAPGIILGTFIGNFLLSPIIYDLVFGTLATMISIALMLRFNKYKAVALLAPVFVNGLVIGFMLASVYDMPFIINFFFVSLGQAVVLYGLGLPLYYYLNKRNDLVELLK